jgi:hypothetical protein
MQLKDSRKDETALASLSLAIELSEQIQNVHVYSFLGSFDGGVVLSQPRIKRMSLMCGRGTIIGGDIPLYSGDVLFRHHGFLSQVYRAFLHLIVFQIRAWRARLLETELLSLNDV